MDRNTNKQVWKYQKIQWFMYLQYKFFFYIYFVIHGIVFKQSLDTKKCHYKFSSQKIERPANIRSKINCRKMVVLFVRCCAYKRNVTWWKKMFNSGTRVFTWRFTKLYFFSVLYFCRFQRVLLRGGRIIITYIRGMCRRDTWVDLGKQKMKNKKRRKRTRRRRKKIKKKE